VDACAIVFEIGGGEALPTSSRIHMLLEQLAPSPERRLDERTSMQVLTWLHKALVELEHAGRN